MKTKRVIKPPYTIRSLMKRKEPSKLIRYSKDNWVMGDWLANINLWIIVDKSEKINYYDEDWTSRWTILFTDKPVKLGDDSVGQFIVVWRWRRDLIAHVSAFKSFKQAKKARDKAIGICYKLAGHAEWFVQESELPDYANTLGMMVSDWLSVEPKRVKRKRRALDVDHMRERKFGGKAYGLESVSKNLKRAQRGAAENETLGFLTKITKRKIRGTTVYDLWLHHPDEWR